MAIFKCKMCGGELNLTEGATVAECEYCGTQQTLPRLKDASVAALYDRAGHFRRNNEFDKAMGIYEQILSYDTTDAEAYWSLVLCSYGVEYVEDPRTHRRMITVNRIQYTSVFDDENYKSALQYADVVQRALYQEEATTINNLQKNFLQLSQQEEPFDVFICYKETNERGQRTPDSVLAQELYYELTDLGLKVFFARITLEDKLGSAYEPYIFAALNSAKVMVVLGTRAEHFSAVWVRNEWSRYLALIKGGARKILIPAYRDMDPYDLPEEFSHLQAQDMAKLGFMQDLVRGIGKVVGIGNAPAAPVVQETVVPGGIPVVNLLKRAAIALEDNLWSDADDYCEKALDMDPENGEAYLYKFMAAAHVPTREELDLDPDILLAPSRELTRDAARVRRFATGELASWLAELDRNAETRREGKRLIEEAKRREAEERRRREEALARQAEEERQRIARQKEAEAERERQRLAALEAEKDAARKLLRQLQDMLACGFHWGHSACVKADGTVLVADKPRHRPYQATEWRNITAVSVGPFHIVGMRRNGTAVSLPVDYKTKVDSWGGLIAISTGDSHTAGLMSHGRVQTCGSDVQSAAQWCDIADISSGADHLVGLKTDGTVVATGKNKEGQCNVSDWCNVRAVSAGSEHTVALLKNGTALATGSNLWGQCSLASWTDLVAVSAGIDSTLGLRSDGTVYVACTKKSGIAEAETWTDMVAICAGYECCLGLKADGTVLAAGRAKLNKQMLHGMNLFDTMPPAEKEAFVQQIRDVRNTFLK